MPKMKTKSGAKKRFKVSASGRIKHASTFGNHPCGVTSNGETQKDRLSLRLEVEG
jgi:large subunit ribosomal protein L35